jgi:hypothetical protein
MEEKRRYYRVITDKSSLVGEIFPALNVYPVGSVSLLVYGSRCWFAKQEVEEVEGYDTKGV